MRSVEYINKQLLEHPELKPIIHIVKRILKFNNLNSSFTGKYLL